MASTYGLPVTAVMIRRTTLRYADMAICYTFASKLEHGVARQCPGARQVGRLSFESGITQEPDRSSLTTNLDYGSWPRLPDLVAFEATRDDETGDFVDTCLQSGQ